MKAETQVDLCTYFMKGPDCLCVGFERGSDVQRWKCAER